MDTAVWRDIQQARFHHQTSGTTQPFRPPDWYTSQNTATKVKKTSTPPAEEAQAAATHKRARS